MKERHNWWSEKSAGLLKAMYLRPTLFIIGHSLVHEEENSLLMKRQDSST